MSTADSDKRLLAIYKLKFYKNKKKWKLSEDVVKESPSQTNCKLDETYNIDNVDQVDNAELESVHNKAFLDEEPADEPQECVALSSPCLCLHSCGDHAWPKDQSDPLWQDAQQVPSYTQEWCGVEGEGSADELAEHPHYRPWTRPAWPSDLEYDLKPSYAPVCRPLSPRAVLSSAQQWLRELGYEPPEETCPYPLEESIEFVRGAHHAPHSSETDLSTNNDDASSVCTWSGSRLRRGVLEHCEALATLLAERTQREILYGRSPPKPAVPLDEYPTRDTDPLRPPDFILSGSHRPADTRWLADVPDVPDTLPDTLPDIMPSDCRMPDIMPSDCRLADIMPSECRMPDTMPSECRMPDTMPSDYRLLEIMPSECRVPGVLPSECMPVMPLGRGRGRLLRSKPVIRIGMGRPYRM